MDRHIKELTNIIPDLFKRRSLDLGSGKGKFVIEFAKLGGEIIGIEPYKEYLEISRNNITENNLNVEILEGEGEYLPFENESFDFININEVIEHVNDPIKMLSEVLRVLSTRGISYLSVPNRFGFKDQHFNLYFVNWLPRNLSNIFISIFGKHKKYENMAGLQKLNEMHYFTFFKIENILKRLGFEVEDIREIKIKKRFRNIFVRKTILFIYKFLRFFYFDSFHFKIYKTSLPVF